MIKYISCMVAALHNHLGTGSPHETIGRIRVVTDIYAQHCFFLRVISITLFLCLDPKVIKFLSILKLFFFRIIHRRKNNDL